MSSTGLRIRAILGLSMLTVCSATSGARAQDIAGRLHLGAQFTLASAYVSKPKGAAANAGVTVGGQYVNAASLTNLLSPLPGLNVGYAVDERWLISLGGRITRSSLDLDGSGGLTIWSVRPGLRYIFASGQEVRPFIEGGLAFGKGSAADMTTVGADAIAGVQIHFAQRVSVDPYVDFGYMYQYSSDSQGGGVNVDGTEVNGFALTGGITLSVWL